MIVLFTDFGLQGPYTGQIKTVLHQMAPGVRAESVKDGACALSGLVPASGILQTKASATGSLNPARLAVQSNGTIVFVKDSAGGRFLSLQAMPPTVTWMADCGLVGLSVSFGETGQNGNGTEIRLSDASFNETACRTLLPITAAKVGQVLSGN